MPRELSYLYCYKCGRSYTIKQNLKKCTKCGSDLVVIRVNMNDG